MRLFEKRIVDIERLDYFKIAIIIMDDNINSIFLTNFLYYYDFNLYVGVSNYAIQTEIHFYNV